MPEWQWWAFRRKQDAFDESKQRQGLNLSEAQHPLARFVPWHRTRLFGGKMQDAPAGCLVSSRRRATEVPAKMQIAGWSNALAVTGRRLRLP
jgi:hypothetical protein